MTTKVKQLANNQFIITEEHGETLQSYESIIVYRSFAFHPIKLDKKYWNYSKTTSKYRNQFLGETTKETQSKIASGEYILTNLNQ